MRQRLSLVIALVAVLIGKTTVRAQLYWDIDGAATAGAGGGGAPNGTWDSSTPNWSTDSTGASASGAWVPDSVAVFSAGTDAGGSYTITVSGTQSASGITFEDGTPTIQGGTQLTLTGTAVVNVPGSSLVATINSPIGGSVGLDSTGPGVLILGGASTYSGTTLVDVGNTLRLGAANAVPSSSVLGMPTTATSGALFQLNGFDDTVKSISGGNATGPPTIALGTNTLTLNDPNNETYAGLFTASPGGKIVKNGTGSITLSGFSNGFAGGEFVLNSGNLAIGSVNMIGTAANGSKLTINGGTITNATPATSRSMSVANIDIAGSFAYNGTGTANVEWLGTTVGTEGTAVVTLKTANPTITINQTSTGTFIFRGPIGDDGNNYGFTKDGTGVLTLNNPNSTYGGATTIVNGQLRIDDNATLGNGNGALNLSGGTLNVTVTRDPTNNPVANPVNVTADSTIGTSRATVDSTINVNFTSNTVGGTAGTLTLQNIAASGIASQLEVQFSGNGFNFGRPIVIAAGLNAANRTTRLDSGNATGTQTFSGPISGAGSYRRLAGGTTVFSGANTFTGGTTVEGGTLTATGSTATLGAGNVAVTGGNIAISSGVSNAIADAATLSLSGGGTAGVADVGFANLGTGINEQIQALMLGGVAQPNGTYGSSTSSATNKLNEYFSGSGIITVGGVVAGVPGDYNGNGVVDMSDYVLWRNGGPLQNEINTPGTVDASDYTAWRSRFGATSGSGSSLGAGSAVPEPGSLSLMILAFGSLVTFITGVPRRAKSC